MIISECYVIHYSAYINNPLSFTDRVYLWVSYIYGYNFFFFFSFLKSVNYPKVYFTQEYTLPKTVLYPRGHFTQECTLPKSTLYPRVHFTQECTFEMVHIISLKCKYNMLQFGLSISSIEASKQKLRISMSIPKLVEGNPSRSDYLLKSEGIRSVFQKALVSKQPFSAEQLPETPVIPLIELRMNQSF